MKCKQINPTSYKLKGVNFDKKSKTEIKEIETWINNYPRKIFEYDTAENQFINEMEKLIG